MTNSFSRFKVSGMSEKKPWEEIWEAVGDRVRAHRAHGHVALFIRTESKPKRSYERAQLAAQAPAMARLLLKIAPPGSDFWHDREPLGDDIQEVLRAAGVLP